MWNHLPLSSLSVSSTSPPLLCRFPVTARLPAAVDYQIRVLNSRGMSWARVQDMLWDPVYAPKLKEALRAADPHFRDDEELKHKKLVALTSAEPTA